MGDDAIEKLFQMMQGIDRRLIRIEINQENMSDVNRRITSLEISRARLLGYMIGAAGGGGITGSLIANLFGA
jgi:hypothetical protein